MNPTTLAVVTSGACLFVLPFLLRGRRTLDAHPRVALALWATLLALGVASAEIASLRFGLGATTASVPVAVGHFAAHLDSGHPLRGLGLHEVVGLSLAIDIAVVSLGSTFGTAVVARRRRRSHRALLDLVSTPLEHRDEVRVLEHPRPLAYFVPGAKGRVVLTRGALNLLDADELAAVTAHEFGHRRGHHGAWLVTLESLAPFVNFLPLARLALGEMAVLVEMLADDYARSRVRTPGLASALGKSAHFQTAPAGALGISGVFIARRQARLATPTRRVGDTLLATGVSVAALTMVAALFVGH